MTIIARLIRSLKVSGSMVALPYIAELLSGNPLARDHLHHFTEAIQLAQRRVKIRRDANAGEFFVKDWGGEDVMLVKKVAANRALVESFDSHVGDGA